MPYPLLRLLLAVFSISASLLWAVNPAHAQAAVVGDGTPSIEIQGDVQTWLEPGSYATIQIAASSPHKFQSVPGLARHHMTERDTLWIKLRVVRAVGNTSGWTLNIPLPYLEVVHLYERDATGKWLVQTAGNSIAHSEWSKQGLYPEFDLHLPSGVPQDIYLQVRNFKPMGIPLQLVATQHRDFRRQLELVAVGLMLGALLTMSILSAIRYLEHRYSIDGWAALYGLLILTTLAQINGVLGAFLWADLPPWDDYAYSVLPTLGVGSALLFVRELYALSTQYRRFDAFLAGTAWGTIASVLGYLMLDRLTADSITGVVLLFATSVGLVATILSFRSGSPIGRWLMLAYVPQFVGAMYLVAESFGVAPPLWEMRYLTSLCIAMSVPILVYALSRVTHDRKELVVRARHLPTQDALTGLLTPEVFQTHLDDAIQRAIADRQPVALVMVQVVNHEFIRDSYGDTTAEQCLLRAVVKLQRILRDVDPAGRVDTAHFALLMEGISTRQALTERMVQLIGLGLIPLPGLKPEVTLQFHIACVLLHENPVPSDRVLSDLRGVLADMTGRTRRPIRFLEAASTQPAPLHGLLQSVHD
jgi:diguanylate cyclase (GGDEF)-like protein